MDPILDSRLSALRQSLERAHDPSTWKTQLELRNVQFEERDWNWAIMEIRREVDNQLKELKAIRADSEQGADLAASWTRYQRAYRSSQQVFRECLELIGGLALRDKLLDERICQLSDELIIACANAMLTLPSVCVPAQNEILSRTFGRVVRLRFPEWTIWTLPLAAHEYCRVVIETTKPLVEFVETQAKEYVDGLSDPPIGDAMAELVASVERNLIVLLSDAFATYTMGPSYACAAILLRFDPMSTPNGGGEGPTDLARATLVLDTLTGMGQVTDADGGMIDNNVYKTILGPLREFWDAAVAATASPAQVGAGGGGRNEPILEAQAVLDRLGAEFEIRPSVRYPRGEYADAAVGGWSVASRWSAIWKNQADNGETLTLPDVPRASKLRDALNAAWHVRIQLPPKDLPEIEMVARELCDAISESRVQPKRGGRRGGVMAQNSGAVSSASRP